MKEKINDLIDSQDDKNDDLIMTTMEEILELKKKHSSYLRTEVQLETMPQVLLQLTLLLLTDTKTPTTGGLENMFKTTGPFFLAMSIFLSLYSSFKGILRTLAIEKAHFPAVSKLIFFLFAVCACSSKMLTGVMYFTPGLGLLDMNGHWTMEKVSV